MFFLYIWLVQMVHIFPPVSSVKSVSGPMASTTTLKYGPQISLSHVTMKGGGEGGSGPLHSKRLWKRAFFFLQPSLFRIMSRALELQIDFNSTIGNRSISITPQGHGWPTTRIGPGDYMCHNASFYQFKGGGFMDFWREDLSCMHCNPQWEDGWHQYAPITRRISSAKCHQK